MAPESIKTCIDIFSSWTPRPQSWNISYFSYFFFPNKSLLAKRSLDQLFWGERFFSSPIISIHIHHLDSNTFYFVNLRLHYSAIMAFGNFFFSDSSFDTWWMFTVWQILNYLNHFRSSKSRKKFFHLRIFSFEFRLRFILWLSVYGEASKSND